MLEIIVIFALCHSNAKRVRAKGRKPGMFVFYTILLWVGMEFLGALIGTLIAWPNYQSSFLPYGLALLFAIIGGVLSTVVAKNAKPQEEFDVEVVDTSIEIVSPKLNVEWEAPVEEISSEGNDETAVETPVDLNKSQ